MNANELPWTGLSLALVTALTVASSGCDEANVLEESESLAPRSENPDDGPTAVCVSQRLYFDGACRTRAWFQSNLATESFQLRAVIGMDVAQGVGTLEIADEGVLIVEESLLGELSKMRIVRPDGATVFEHVVGISAGSDGFPQALGYTVEQVCDEPTTVTLPSGQTIEVSGQCHEDTVHWFGRDYDVGGSYCDVAQDLNGHVCVTPLTLPGDEGYCQELGAAMVGAAEWACDFQTTQGMLMGGYFVGGASLIASGEALSMKALAGSGAVAILDPFDFAGVCENFAAGVQEPSRELCEWVLESPDDPELQGMELVEQFEAEASGECAIGDEVTEVHSCTRELNGVDCEGTCAKTMPAVNSCNISAAGASEVDFTPDCFDVEVDLDPEEG